MDLGFAGLIEKIEERFGRGVTTALLAALCLVVFVWAGNAIVGTLSATYEIIEKGEGDIWLGILYLMFLLVVSAGISWIIATSVFVRVKKKNEKKINDRIAHAESLDKKTSQNFSVSSEILAVASVNVAEARALIESGKKAFKKLEDNLAQREVRLQQSLIVEVQKRSMKENGQEEQD